MEMKLLNDVKDTFRFCLLEDFENNPILFSFKLINLWNTLLLGISSDFRSISLFLTLFFWL